MQDQQHNVKKNISIVYFDAASGHRSAAAALQKALSTTPGCNVKMVNITEVFDRHPLFGRIVRAGINFFNKQIQSDKLKDLQGLIRLSLWCQDKVKQTGLKKIASYWRDNPADVVISVTPMYNRVLYRSALLTNHAVQCITIPVDFEEVCAGYWFTPSVQQFYLNATQRLQEQAANAGIAADMLFRISGMPADGDAYRNLISDKRSELEKLGLDPQLPTGFLSFGGQGASNVYHITKALAKANVNANMVIMCGRSKRLFGQVNQLQTPFPKVVFNYLPHAPIQFLHLADFAIGKPGAMTITEALITRTPLIALKSTGLEPVQKGNEEWITKTQTGIVAQTPEEVAEAVQQVIDNPGYKTQIEYHHHYAIDECITIINNTIHKTKAEHIHEHPQQSHDRSAATAERYELSR